MIVRRSYQSSEGPLGLNNHSTPRFSNRYGQRTGLSYQKKPWGSFETRFVPRPTDISKPGLRPWTRSTPEQIVRHLYRDHLVPFNLRREDPIQGFDLEGCYHNGIALDWLVEREAALIVEGVEGFRGIGCYDVDPGDDLQQCRVGLVRNLRYIQWLGCTDNITWPSVWRHIQSVIPNVGEITLNLPEDRFDSFGWDQEIFAPRVR